MSTPWITAVRSVVVADLPDLVEVEAGQVFRTIGMNGVADDVPDVADLRVCLKSGRLGATEARVGERLQVAAYVSAKVLDGHAHVAQVSVAPSFAPGRSSSSTSARRP